MLKDRYILRIEELRQDFINPSSVILQKALEAFEEAAGEFIPLNDFNSLYEFVRKLSKAQPSMASLHNILNFACNEIKKGNFSHENIASKMKAIMDKCSKLSIQSAVDYCLTQNFTCFITASYSNVIFEFFKEYLKLKDINIFLLESYCNGTYYGQLLQNDLKNANIDSVIVPDNEIDEGISKCDSSFISSDSFHEEKGAVNGCPSLELAKACQKRIPFSVISESFKRTNKIFETEVFQFIPKNYINNFFIDKIFSSPDHAY